MDNEMNDYERLRQENIVKNKALLLKLQLDAVSVGASKVTAQGGSASKPKKKPPKKEPAASVPRRKSSRLAGLPPESETAKRGYDKAIEELQEADRAKKARISGDISFDLKEGLVDFTKDTRYQRAFTGNNVKETANKDLRALREKMMGLKLYEKHDVKDIKICPERIYHLAFHPVTDKQLIFAGDKIGNVGIFDAQSHKENEDGEEIPDISQFKVHSRTISTFTFEPGSGASLYTSSYDGSVRKFDLDTGVASEVYVGEEVEPLSGVEVIDPNLLYFSTLNGRFGRLDMRQKAADIWTLSEKKIGGFSLHPRAPHLVATGSLDRTVKIWDLRKTEGAGEDKTLALMGRHSSKLSVSCALWSSSGSLATASYDDTVKIYKFPTATKWVVGEDLGTIEPNVTIPHNNQTGRWLTILRPQWQQAPTDGHQKFVIANMDRFIDIFSENGEQLAQLSDYSLTAVPAVTQFHPTQDWVAGGNSSGKVALFT